jgi:hypothetical protein
MFEELAPASNPTIAIYNAGVLKTYNNKIA